MSRVSTVLRRLRAMLRLEGGAAAVEFALIVPFVLVLYTGAVEVIVGIMIDRQVSLVASTVANLTAQYTTISAKAQMPNILNASAQVLVPYPAANGSVVVSCLNIDAKGVATVAWSQTQNGTARTVGSVVTIPASLAAPNTSIVLGEATYLYTPFVDFIRLGSIKLAASTYMVPRSSTTINLTS